MEAWRKEWRDIICPRLSAVDLLALKEGLASNDPGLIQGATVLPPLGPLNHLARVEGACAIGYCGWKARDMGTNLEVNDFFNTVRPVITKAFINWFDATPRGKAFLWLLEEVERAIETGNHLPVHRS